MATERATTVHGDVEYTTVECTSCGNEVVEDEAYGFILYDESKLKRTRSWSNNQEWKIYDGGYEQGYVCPFCYESGPADYPRIRSTTTRFNELYEALFVDDDFDNWRFVVAVFFFASLGMWITLIVAVLTGGVP